MSLSELSPGTWTVDPAHSDVAFVARHLMVTKVRGRFTDVSGTVRVAEEFSDSTVTAAASVASVATGNDDRDAHLRSDDFFAADEFPEITFASTAVTPSSLTGDLTIKGVTKPVTFDLEFSGVAADPWGNTKAGFSAETEISRKEFGLEWNVALETGGVLVGDKVKIQLDIQAVKA